jgi:hypothetical protein
MITIHLEDWEDVEELLAIFQQIGHHFPCQCHHVDSDCFGGEEDEQDL